jgi:VWFA-related protein
MVFNSNPMFAGLAAFFFLLLSPYAGRQTQAPQATVPPTVFKTDVENVVLDVVVTDHDGRPVTGLRKEDFSVYEDGQAQTVQYFNAPEADAAKADQATEGRAVIVLDALNSKFEDFAYAVGSVKKLLGTEKTLPQPTALMMLNEHGLRMLHDYTTDSGAILAAMDKQRRDISISLRGDAMPFADVVDISLGAMEQLARANLGSGRQQSVLWVSAGIQTQSLESLWSSNLNDYVRALRLLSDEMLRSRTTMNAIDPQGVGMGRVTPQGLLVSPDGEYDSGDLATSLNAYESGASNLTLGTLTQQTGGVYLYNRNDVDAEIGRALADAATAYALAYSPSNHDYNGKFRKLKIDVHNPAWTVRCRPGYFALPATVLVSNSSAYEIRHALTAQVNYAGVGVTVQAQPAAADQQPVQIAVDSHTLNWQVQSDGKYQAHIELLAVSFNAKQKALYQVRRTMSANLAAAAYPQALEKPWNIALNIPLDKSATRVRVVLRDTGSQRIGSAQTALP